MGAVRISGELILSQQSWGALLSTGHPAHLAKEKTMGRLGQFKDLTGTRFGMLTVIKIDREVPVYKNGKRKYFARYWLCQCDCGKTKSFRSTHLTETRKATIVESCGCLLPEYHRSSAWKAKSRKIGTAFRRCLDQYKANARNRGLSWDLTEEQFRSITQSPCHYTGEKPSTVKRTRCDEYVHNGIDRVDNSKGYTLENCVPCCSVINQMKADLSLERFTELCNKVSERYPKCLLLP